MGDNKGTGSIGFKKGFDNLPRLSFRTISSGRNDGDFDVSCKPSRKTGGISLGYIFTDRDKNVVPFILGVHPGKSE